MRVELKHKKFIISLISICYFHLGSILPCAASEDKKPNLLSLDQLKATIDANQATSKPQDVVAIIEGKKITNEDLDNIGSGLDPNILRMPADKKRASILKLYINMLSLAKQAQKDAIDKSEDYKNLIELARNDVLQKLFIRKEIVDKISDDDIKKRYEKEIASLPREEEIHARHIIVKTKEAAMGIIKRLEKGEDFSAIAKKSSVDGSSSVGGDLGYFSHGQMVEPFEKAAFALKIGEYTHQPVQTPFGWHIIKLEDKRQKKLPSLDDMYDSLRNLIALENYNDLIKKLRKNIDVKIVNKNVEKDLALLEKSEDNAIDSDDDQDAD